MSTAFAFTQVDVFTEQPLLGNPLAVVHGADALDDARMQAFTPYEPEFAAIDCDDEGPLPDAVAERGRGARFLYVLPNFQTPSGRSIGAARRAAIVASAE